MDMNKAVLSIDRLIEIHGDQFIDSLHISKELMTARKVIVLALIIILYTR